MRRHSVPPHLFSVWREHGRVRLFGPPHVALGHRLDRRGIFGGWTWDGDRLTIERDRFGVFPLFYAASRDRVTVSTSVDALLANGVPPALDDAAMAVFLRTGFFIGEDTPFAAIRAVPASGSWTWTAREGVRATAPWQPPRATSLSRKEAIDAFADAVGGSIRRSLAATAGPIVLPLTGGRDSRHILLALQELGCLPDRCVTAIPNPPNAPEDVSVAAALAAAARVPHDVLPRRTDRIAAEREKNQLTHFCSDEHVQFLPVRDYLKHRPAAVFDGLGGDVLSQSTRLDSVLHRAFGDSRWDAIADRVLGDKAIIEPALQHLLTKNAMHRFNRPLAMARVTTEAARHAGAPNPIAAFFFFTRMRREIALVPYALLDVCQVWTPFLDSDVVELMMSLPFDLVADRQLHDDTLLERYPQCASIPFAGKNQGQEDAAAVRHDAAALMRLMLKSSSALVDVTGIVARSARAWLLPKSARVWFLPRIVHLLDVERLADGPISAPSPAADARPLAAV
jgi:asparagine synthase (glutamine-hydrolysing)